MMRGGMCGEGGVHGKGGWMAKGGGMCGKEVAYMGYDKIQRYDQ